MSCEFWWNWWVQFAVAAATLLSSVTALVIAICGHRLRHKWFPPKLTLSIVDVKGVHAEREGGKLGRWYHVEASNEARWSKANQVRIFLLQVEEPGPNGELQVRWTGEQQLIWENVSLYPLARTVGANARADLCAVVEENELWLRLLIAPYNLKFKFTESCILVLTLKACSDEGDSPPLRIRISWNGKWEKGEQEMAQHLVLEPV